MTREQAPLRKLMETDVTVLLAIAVLVVCGVGFFFGAGAALRTLGYGFVALLAAGVPLPLLYGRHAELEHLRDLQQVYGGQLRRGWPWRGPSLDFTHLGNPAVIRLVRRHQRHRPDDMQIEVQWPGAPVRLEVCPQGLISSLGRLAGLQDIDVGRPSFDDAYLVRGDDAAQVRRLLEPEVQRRIAALPEQKYLAIRLGGRRLVVQTQYNSLHSDLAGFTKAALELYDALRESDQGCKS